MSLLTGANVDTNTLATAAQKMQAPAGMVDHGAQLKIEIRGLDHSGSDQFRAALERHMGAGGAVGKPGAADNSQSLGHGIANRTTGRATVSLFSSRT